MKNQKQIFAKIYHRMVYIYLGKKYITAYSNTKKASISDHSKKAPNKFKSENFHTGLENLSNDQHQYLCSTTLALNFHKQEKPICNSPNFHRTHGCWNGQGC